MMNIELRREDNRGLEKAYLQGNTFRHNTGNSIKLFLSERKEQRNAMMNLGCFMVLLVKLFEFVQIKSLIRTSLQTSRQL